MYIGHFLWDFLYSCVRISYHITASTLPLYCGLWQEVTLSVLLWIELRPPTGYAQVLTPGSCARDFGKRASAGVIKMQAEIRSQGRGWALNTVTVSL